MRFSLAPREAWFYDAFTEAADNLVTAAELLCRLVNGGDRQELAAQLRDVEHAGDEVTHKIMRRMNSTFVTPFDREDIYRLTSGIDDVLDHMEAAADSIVLYKVDDLPPGTSELVNVIERASRCTAAAMPRLRSMAGLEEYWIEVNRLENEADRIYRRIMAWLFDDDHDALVVLKLKEVVDTLEAAADALESVANAVESIVVKES